MKLSLILILAALPTAAFAQATDQECNTWIMSNSTLALVNSSLAGLYADFKNGTVQENPATGDTADHVFKSLQPQLKRSAELAQKIFEQCNGVAK
jgi:hypothetical protein